METNLLYLFDPQTEKKSHPKKTNIASTSRESFRTLNDSGQRINEKFRVLKIIRENQPLTSRQLSKLANIDRTNITRTLYDLIEHKAIKIAFNDLCPSTGRRVRFYSMIYWQA